jgi:RNA polymerase sigma-B factor
MSETNSPLSKDAIVLKYCAEKTQELKEKIVVSYTPLVQYIVKRFSYNRNDFEDLLQIGLIGLLKSLERFDPSKEVDFSTYATPNVIGEIKHYFRDKQNILKIPRRLQELNSKIRKVIKAYQNSHGSPTVAQIAQELQVTEEEVIEAIEARACSSVISLDSPPSNSKNANPFSTGSSTLLDSLGIDHDEEYHLNKVTLKLAIFKLEKRSQKIIYLRFYRGLSQAEIATEMNLSQMHISRLINKSIKQLRKYIKI